MGKKAEKKENLIKKEIFGFILLAISSILFLSMFTETAGIVGRELKSITNGLFGSGAYIFPVIMLVYSFFIFKSEDEAYIKQWHKYILLFMLFWLATFFNILSIGNAKYEGGLIGDLIGGIFTTLFGSFTIILLVVSAIVTFIYISRKSVINMITILLAKLKEKIKNIRVNKKHNAFSEPKKKAVKKEKTLVEKLEEDVKDEPIKIQINNFKNNKQELEKEAKAKAEAQIEDNITEELEKAKAEKIEYNYPSIELLDNSEIDDDEFSEEKMMESAKVLEETLDSFGVGAKVTQISRGPSVTRYELKPKTGIKVSKIVNLADDIALNLAAEGVRIEAPIPGKAAIGIEVANKNRQMVNLKQVFEDENFVKFPSKLAFGLGKDISGNTIVADIAKMPHLLIAGATGSGKSVCINTLVTSILYKADPNEVKLIMIDPKVVELKVYNGIPHLLIPVVTDPKKAASALNWAVQEMISRYQKFAESNVRDIKGYNNLVEKDEELEFMPQLVIIIDELADLMMAAAKDVEDAICRLAQMARAAGIHLIIATQRPSVDVITGVIKANIPSRISFAVSSGIDSRTILDMNGAEKLLGKGDMLFYPVGAAKPVRVQGAFISDGEVENIVEHIKENFETEYDESVIKEITTVKNTIDGASSDDKDEFFEDAVKLMIDKDKASISMFQRAFRIGYNRAARLMDSLEGSGLVGAEDGSKPRSVLVTLDEYEQMKLNTED